MCGNGHSVNSQLGDIERNMQVALDGIGMKQGAGSMCGSGKFADGLHHAGLIVGDHNAHERHVVTQQVDQRGRVNEARAAGLHQVDGKAGGAQQR